MPHSSANQTMTRRAMLGSTALAAAGSLTAGSAELAGGQPSPSTVRDRFWIFTVAAGLDNKSLELGGIRGGSRMTPAEGAFWLDVPNLLLIRSNEEPRLPGDEPQRTKTSFQQYAISFQPLNKVVWSVVGSGGKGGMAELDPFLPLAKEFSNFHGIYLDDFIIDRKKRDNGRVVGRPALSPTELESARLRLKAVGRPQEIWVTLYSHELLPDHPRGIGCDPPLSEFLHLFDVLTLWTWNSDELTTLDASLAALEAAAPKDRRIALGMYMWDFFNRKPVPVERMEHQCETGLKWLQEGRIHEMIFLANTVLDIGLPSAEFARQWIARVGDQPVNA